MHKYARYEGQIQSRSYCLKEIACRKKAKYTLITFALFYSLRLYDKKTAHEKVNFLWQVTLTDFLTEVFDISAALLSHC